MSLQVEEAWEGEPGARGSRGHCSPAGPVSGVLTDVTRAGDRLWFTVKRVGEELESDRILREPSILGTQAWVVASGAQGVGQMTRTVVLDPGPAA